MPATLLKSIITSLISCFKALQQGSSKWVSSFIMQTTLERFTRNVVAAMQLGEKNRKISFVMMKWAHKQKGCHSAPNRDGERSCVETLRLITSCKSNKTIIVSRLQTAKQYLWSWVYRVFRDISVLSFITARYVGESIKSCNYGVFCLEITLAWGVWGSSQTRTSPFDAVYLHH